MEMEMEGTNDSMAVKPKVATGHFNWVRNFKIVWRIWLKRHWGGGERKREIDKKSVIHSIMSLASLYWPISFHQNWRSYDQQALLLNAIIIIHYFYLSVHIWLNPVRTTPKWRLSFPSHIMSTCWKSTQFYEANVVTLIVRLEESPWATLTITVPVEDIFTVSVEYRVYVPAVPYGVNVTFCWTIFGLIVPSCSVGTYKTAVMTPLPLADVRAALLTMTVPLLESKEDCAGKTKILSLTE